jgi:hypothetical protein
MFLIAVIYQVCCNLAGDQPLADQGLRGGN